MLRDPSQRHTRVTLLVEWDPKTQDHPMGWDWEGLVSNRDIGSGYFNKIEVQGFEEDEKDDRPLPT